MADKRDKKEKKSKKVKPQSKDKKTSKRTKQKLEQQSTKENVFANDVQSMIMSLGIKPEMSTGQGLDKVQLPSDDSDLEDIPSAEEDDVPPPRSEPKQRKTKPAPKAKTQPFQPSVTQQITRGKAAHKILIPATPRWYEYTAPELPIDDSLPVLSDTEIENLHRQAEALYKEECAAFGTKNQAGTSQGNQSFLSSVMQSGTLSDKMSAFTLLVQESPLHTWRSFQFLLNGTSRKNRRESSMAISSIKDLLTNNLLPDRKLRYFRDQPLGHSGVRPVHLILWHYEDLLKKAYYQFIQALEVQAFDPLFAIKRSALTITQELLAAKPEQEANLLRLLVNKLGDSERKVAAKASFLILQLLDEHAAMRLVVIGAIEDLVLHPSTTDRAIYYAMITLNQIVLNYGDRDVANKLTGVYFWVFHKVLTATEEKTKEVEDTETTAVKDNPNHVVFDSEPSEDEGKGDKQESRDALKKKNKKKKPRWRNLPDEGRQKRQEQDKRCGQLLARQAKKRIEKQKEDLERIENEYSKLLAAILTGVNRSLPFANLDNHAFDEYVEMLFRLVHFRNFNTVIQAFVLLYQMSQVKVALKDRFYRVLYEAMLDFRLVLSSKQVMFLNVLLKSLSTDPSSPRVMAFVKRMLQIATFHDVPMVCGLLFVVGKVMSSRPPLHGMINQPEDNDGEEHFDDVISDAEEEVTAETQAMVDASEKADGEDENDADADVQPDSVPTATNISEKYDPVKRDPRYALAEITCLWELLPFTQHFHPSVRLYASRLLSMDFLVDATPNLHNFSLHNFLDKFVFRNPKKNPVKFKGQSLMQPRVDEINPRKSGDANYIVSKKVFTGVQWGVPNKKLHGASGFPADEEFLHAYHIQKKERSQARKETAEVKKDSNDYDDDVGEQSEFGSMDEAEDDDGEFGDLEDVDESEIWKAMKKGMPELGDLEDNEVFSVDGSQGEDDDEEAELLHALQDDEELGRDIEEDFDNQLLKAGSDGEESDEFVSAPEFSYEGEEEGEEFDDDDDDLPVESNVTSGKRKKRTVSKSAVYISSLLKTQPKGKGHKKIKLADLPLVASMEDYAHLLDQD
ncbi:RNA-binding ribosome biosynthesis protein mak21 [Dispira simplex]|nr:RNA-binding ribosome biosynthesis protein mak21 [Dispira simplex]